MENLQKYITLITKNKDSTSSKTKKALELNVKILTKEEFIHNYLS